LRLLANHSPINRFGSTRENTLACLAPSSQLIHSREVITLTEPQVWTLIGVFSAAIFGMLTNGFASLRSEIRNTINSLRNEMNTRFDAVEKRIDYLDRDVQYLICREFGDSTERQ